MAKSGKQQISQHDDKETKLNGTFVSVLLLGAFLVLTWVGIFALFINRN